MDDIYHHRVCSWCQTIEVEKHDWKLKATSQNPEIHTYRCDSCGQLKTEGSSGLVGDFTNDGILDNRDIETFLWSILFPESYKVQGENDFNGDGMVDERDVEQLLWHTLFPERYPLKG